MMKNYDKPSIVFTKIQSENIITESSNGFTTVNKGGSLQFANSGINTINF